MPRKKSMSHKEVKETLDIARSLILVASLGCDDSNNAFNGLNKKLEEAVDIAKLAIDLMDEKISIEKKEDGNNE